MSGHEMQPVCVYPDAIIRATPFTPVFMRFYEGSALPCDVKTKVIWETDYDLKLHHFDLISHDCAGAIDLLQRWKNSQLCKRINEALQKAYTTDLDSFQSQAIKGLLGKENIPIGMLFSCIPINIVKSNYNYLIVKTLESWTLAFFADLRKKCNDVEFQRVLDKLADVFPVFKIKNVQFTPIKEKLFRKFTDQCGISYIVIDGVAFKKGRVDFIETINEQIRFLAPPGSCLFLNRYIGVLKQTPVTWTPSNPQLQVLIQAFLNGGHNALRVRDYPQLIPPFIKSQEDFPVTEEVMQRLLSKDVVDIKSTTKKRKITDSFTDKVEIQKMDNFISAFLNTNSQNESETASNSIADMLESSPAPICSMPYLDMATIEETQVTQSHSMFNDNNRIWQTNHTFSITSTSVLQQTHYTPANIDIVANHAPVQSSNIIPAIPAFTSTPTIVTSATNIIPQATPSQSSSIVPFTNNVSLGLLPEIKEWVNNNQMLNNFINNAAEEQINKAISELIKQKVKEKLSLMCQ